MTVNNESVGQVNKDETFGQKFKDFFTQRPRDYIYEDKGGNANVPFEERTDDPKADANEWARKHEQPLPYPEHTSEASVAEDADATVNDDPVS